MESKRKTILIVEDELSQRTALRDKFLKSGFDILESRNGEDGIKKALDSHPDIILLDILMPVMDGVDMVKKLRSDDWGKDVPVIVLSNSNAITKVQEALDNEVFDYFLKSDTPLDVLVEKVRTILKIS